MILEAAGAEDFQPVAMVQEQAQRILGDYVRNRHPNQPERYIINSISRLLHQLSNLCNF